MMYGNYNPYQSMMMQPQCQTLQRVNGIEGAKSFQLGANSTVALFDSNSDIFYVKSTDSAGFPSIRIFKFEEINQLGNNTDNDYISRNEFEQFKKEMMDYGKQFIQQPTKEESTK